MGERLRFVFRNFPISTSHLLAERAAEAVEAAGLQGRYWQMHDCLYEHQDRWWTRTSAPTPRRSRSYQPEVLLEALERDANAER